MTRTGETRSLRLMLATGSPRRRDLLGGLGIGFDSAAVDIDETLDYGVSARATVERLALAKAKAAAERYPASLILAADTLVSLAGVALGKPRDAEQAREMLRALRGHEHEVLTGVCLLTPPPALVSPPCTQVVQEHPATRTRVAGTRVTMRHYSDSEIERSIRQGVPCDKAGAYAIQDTDFAPVASFEGCHCNVVGLPLWAVFELLSGTEVDGRLLRPDNSLAVCSQCPLAN